MPAQTPSDPTPGAAATPPAGQPTDSTRVRVHYHRYDGRYDGVTLWTWDPGQKRTPQHNEIEPAGKTDFGVYFEFDPADYGDGNGRVGLLPRFHRDWNQKDGRDKFWNPDLGREVWIVGTQHTIHAQRPDISPQVLAAYADGARHIVFEMNHAVTNAEIHLDSVDIRDAAGRRIPVVETNLVTAHSGETRALRFHATTSAPLPLDAGVVTAALARFGKPVPVQPRGVLDDPALYGDTSMPMGIAYEKGATRFTLFAPTATGVYAVLYDRAEGFQGRVEIPLRRAPKGLWEATVPGDLEGKFCTYRLEGPGLDATHETVDPYATNTVLSTTRARITDLAKTDPPGWATLKQGPKIASPTDAVIFEMHVRDFTIAENSGARDRGKYTGFVQPGTRLPGDPAIKTGLDHLVELGVTHVQLLPVQDFANDERADRYNWGYITSAFNSPEGLYASDPADESRIREFKALVAALHERRIGVILDVVYNHTADDASFHFIAPDYYYRKRPDGSLRNGSGCGNDFRTEAPMARRFLIESLVYWVREYGVDGFRFDLMALLDQETMREAEKALRAIKPDILLYGEPWMADWADSPQHPTDKQGIRGTGIGAFNDDFRNSLQGSPGDTRDIGWLQNGSRAQGVRQGMTGTWIDWPESPGQSLQYMTCHDNYVLYDKLKASMPNASEETIHATMKLGYLALFTAQGVPFLHGGEEFARTKFGDHNSYESPDSVNRVDWALKRQNFGMFSYVRDLIAIRRAHPVFRLRTKEEIARRVSFPATPGDNALLVLLDGRGVPGENWNKVCVALNTSPDPITLDLPPGAWTVAFDRGGAVVGHPTRGSLEVQGKSGAILYQR